MLNFALDDLDHARSDSWASGSYGNDEFAETGSYRPIGDADVLQSIQYGPHGFGNSLCQQGGCLSIGDDLSCFNTPSASFGPHGSNYEPAQIPSVDSASYPWHFQHPQSLHFLPDPLLAPNPTLDRYIAPATQQGSNSPFDHSRAHDVQLQQRLYRCRESGCNKAFTALRSLERHSRTFHGGLRPFPCPYPGCEFSQKRFNRKDTLERHLKRKHH